MVTDDIKEMIASLRRTKDWAKEHDTWSTDIECILLALVYDAYNKLEGSHIKGSCKHCYHYMYCDASDVYLWKDNMVPPTFWRALR